MNNSKLCCAGFVQLVACVFLYWFAIQGAEARFLERSECGSKFHCTENGTFFDTSFEFNCYCDKACYQIYSDCCPDYQKHCGHQKQIKTFKKNRSSLWKCVELELTQGECTLEGALGIWMVQKCPKYWPFDKTRKKCETFQIMQAGTDYIPVVGDNNFTYRNRHCAECNRVQNYTTWDIVVLSTSAPSGSLDSKLKFIVESGGRIENIRPGTDQPRRYCAGKNYVNNCSILNHKNYSECLNGPVEVVTGEWSYDGPKYFKNLACSSCNGQPDRVIWTHHFPSCTSIGNLPEGFSIMTFNSQGTIVQRKTSSTPNICPCGTVYDSNLEICRKGYVVYPENTLSNEFLVALWFKKYSVKESINSNFAEYLESALTYNFSLLAKQISKITLYDQNKNGFLVATFQLTLTPFQSLFYANQVNSNTNITSENTAFLKIFNFTETFTLFSTSFAFHVHVVKLRTKQISCHQGKTFASHEYEIENKTKKLFVSKTGEIFLLNDYTLLKNDGGNITLCRKLVLSGCNGAYVPLSPNEYVILSNWSIYYILTGSIFNFGQYLISESLNTAKENSNIFNATQDSVLLKNYTISVCLPFKNAFNKTETNYTTTTTFRTASYGVRILTLIGFSVSIICLILLLITYGLFQKLRTVPGMNLMNLGISMLLADLVWLVGTTHFKQTPICEIFAILEHYLFQVSFLAMSIISYHTRCVFSQPFVRRNINKSWLTFVKYSAVVWVIPAIFVAGCVTLDKTEVFLVDYGINCWLGDENARLYLFLLPLAILLLYNIYTFIQTAIILSRQEEERKAILQRNERKRNLFICIKLATLVGFPWLFVFFLLWFPHIEAFEYLFVVFVCLQGLYIGIVFLFNKKTLKLYKDRWDVYKSVPNASPLELS